MKEDAHLLDIVQDALGTFEYRQSYSPGMFEPLKPLFRRLGYNSVAVYIADDYPDRMQTVSGYGDDNRFPPYVALNGGASLHDRLVEDVADMPQVMTARLFSHGRELGALAATHPRARNAKVREAFDFLARSMSIMAYLERVRTNGRREREERDIFFAQSLTNRLLIREAPKMKNLRLGFEFVRSLDAGGDFFDLVPETDGSLFGFVGSCSGTGLRTVMEVCSIMRVIHRASRNMSDLTPAMRQVNDMLVREKKRAHQASLCMFHVDPARRSLRLTSAGRLGILMCGPGAKVENISAFGATFLGMVDKPDIHDAEYDFKPGQSLFCVTEGFYSSHNWMKVRPQLHWFLESLTAVLETPRREPLAKAIFDCVNRGVDHTARPDTSMLAVSVEYLGKSTAPAARPSVRRKKGAQG